MAEATLSRSAIYSARPGLRVAGQEDERVSELLTAMKMEEAEGGMASLELRFNNWVSTTDGGHAEIGFGSNSPLKLGAELAVYGGDLTAQRELFRGKISALEIQCTFGKAPELVVLAEDALTAARRGRRSKVYADMSPAAVVEAIAKDLGLDPHVAGLSAPTGTWAQLNETDLGFLRRLLARFDADLQIAGSKLQAAPRGEVRRNAIDLTLYSQLAQVRVCADLADQATAVTVAGWNAADGAAVKGEASSLAHGAPGQGRSGMAWAQDAFGARSEHMTLPAVTSDAEAQAVAQAALDRRARRFVRAEGVSEGNPELRVGSHVSLSGISSQFDNTYYVVHTRHLFDMTQGYRTEFRAECAFLGG
jgi:phage protein D